MPLAMYQELSPNWGLGQTVCNMWVSFDVTCCTASILNLCTISIDRYFTITRPLTYGVNASSKRSLCFIVAIWVASCLISVPPLLLFGNEHGSQENPACQVSQNIIYQLYATLGAFYIPLLVMIIMYYKIYVAAKKVVEAEHKAAKASKRFYSHSLASDKNELLMMQTTKHEGHETSAHLKRTHDSTFALVVSPVDHRMDYNSDGHQKQIPVKSKARSSTQSRQSLNAASSISSYPEEKSAANDRLLADRGRCSDLRGSFSTVSAVDRNRADSRFRSSTDLRERKASVTLGVIMTAFTVCWLPFFILALLRPFSQSVYRVPYWIVSFALWLGYANSMLNPIIYVLFHQDFRQVYN